MRLSEPVRGIAFAACLFVAPAALGSAELVRGDTLWERRGEGQIDARAQAEPIRAAIAAYEAAVAAEPENLAAYWKLLRALWFCAEFATDDPSEERALYARGNALSERAFSALAGRLGGGDVLESTGPVELRALLPAADHSDAAHLYFWSAINLGAWSRMVGLLSAVRAGVATRLHESTLRSIELDPSVEQGGAIRLLSRLQSELPRVPLLSGWVEHRMAVPLAERALAEYPGHPGNPYLLALALLSHAPARRSEALQLLERTAALEPRGDHVVEDVAIRIAARERLAQERRD
jgi:tetratricopeptide (TPR) repeat protein